MTGPTACSARVNGFFAGLTAEKIALSVTVLRDATYLAHAVLPFERERAASDRAPT